MAGVIGRWLSDAIRPGLPLVLALLAMQVPALAHGYAAALLPLSPEQREQALEAPSLLARLRTLLAALPPLPDLN